MNFQKHTKTVLYSVYPVWLFLIVLIGVLYYPTLHNGFFCWDDKAIALAPSIRTLDVPGLLAAFSSFHFGLYHPVTTISFMIDFWMGNGAAFPFHLTNLILHTLNTILIFVILTRLTGDRLISFIACLLFAVHPVHVEAVAWITSRKDLLSLFFFLLSVLSYLNFKERKNRGIHFLLTFIFVAMALLSKIHVVTLPFVFLLIDFYKGKTISARNLAEKVPFFVICILFGILNLMAQREYSLTSYGYNYNILERGFLFIYSISWVASVFRMISELP